MWKQECEERCRLGLCDVARNKAVGGESLGWVRAA